MQTGSLRASTVRSSRAPLTVLERSVLERDPFAAFAAPHDCVADLRSAVAVLEGRTVRRDVGVVRDRTEEVMQLVHERFAPADDVPWRPPMLPPRMLHLGDEHRLEATCPVAVVAEHLQLVQALHVEHER